MDEANVREWLRSRGHYGDIVALESQADTVSRIIPECLNGEIALFHNIAGRLPPIEGLDYGALLLEEAADHVAIERGRRLYQEALFRAFWAAAYFDFGTRESTLHRRLMKKYEALKSDRG